MTVIGYVFPKLETGPFRRGQLNFQKILFQNILRQSTYQTVCKTARQQFHQIVWTLWQKLSQKMYFLFISEIFGLLVDILTANIKYYLCNKSTFSQLIQMQLYRKQQFLSQFFAEYLKLTSNFEHFQNKDNPQRLCIFEIRYYRRDSYLNV